MDGKHCLRLAIKQECPDDLNYKNIAKREREEQLVNSQARDHGIKRNGGDIVGSLSEQNGERCYIKQEVNEDHGVECPVGSNIFVPTEFKLECDDYSGVEGNKQEVTADQASYRGMDYTEVLTVDGGHCFGLTIKQECPDDLSYKDTAKKKHEEQPVNSLGEGHGVKHNGSDMVGSAREQSGEGCFIKEEVTEDQAGYVGENYTEDLTIDGEHFYGLAIQQKRPDYLTYKVEVMRKHEEQPVNSLDEGHGVKWNGGDMVGSAREQSGEGCYIKQEVTEDHVGANYTEGNNIFLPTEFKLECDDDDSAVEGNAMTCVTDEPHTSTTDEPNDEQQHHCDVCGKVYKRRCHLVVHSRKHPLEKPYKCVVRDKSFSDHRNLVAHIKSHSEKRPYNCGVCRKSFAQKRYLRRHSLTHTGERPYSCIEYGESFTVSSLLKSTKKHSGEKPYECTVCQKSFATKNFLLQHTRTHTGEKPFSCTVCGKSFSASKSLQNHAFTHDVEKPYLCTVCGKSFIQRSVLQHHTRTHTGKKPYTCIVCGKSFTQFGSLQYHTKTHHAAEEFVAGLS